ncbi:MAG: hypothetical protein OXR66_09070 [Candidatus Woesearchaeota archaeon]|nr:hypothetical protein [Candidatus Woesearchaeota archaeon]
MRHRIKKVFTESFHIKAVGDPQEELNGIARMHAVEREGRLKTQVHGICQEFMCNGESITYTSHQFFYGIRSHLQQNYRRNIPPEIDPSSARDTTPNITRYGPSSNYVKVATEHMSLTPQQRALLDRLSSDLDTHLPALLAKLSNHTINTDSRVGKISLNSSFRYLPPRWRTSAEQAGAFWQGTYTPQREGKDTVTLPTPKFVSVPIGGQPKRY